jgi:hypothetical protein
VTNGDSQGCEGVLILPRGLTHCRTYNELKDLVLTEAGSFHSGDIVVCDLRGELGDFADEPMERLSERRVVERSTSLSA